MCKCEAKNSLPMGHLRLELYKTLSYRNVFCFWVLAKVCSVIKKLYFFSKYFWKAWWVKDILGTVETKRYETFFTPLGLYFSFILSKEVSMFIIFIFTFSASVLGVDGSTCIHPQRTPKKQKFWKFFAIQGIGCIDRQSSRPGGWGHRTCAPIPLAGTAATLWQVVTCVLHSGACLPGTIGFHWMLSATGEEVTTSPLVDINLIYTLRIISYD